jgi:PAS domain S-box-containing protein
VLTSSPAVVPSVLFERAWDAAPIGKAVVDLDGNLIRGNPALERMLEAEDGKLVGASLVEVVGELLLDPDALAKAMFEDEHDVVLPSGNTVRLHFSVAVVHEEGELIGFVVQMQDVTERHRLEEERATLDEQLVRSNQELEEFASVASHDLQEPLRKIRAFSDRLVSRHAERLGDAATTDLVRIQDAAARMQVLIDDVLAYSRVDRRPVGFAVVDLTEIIAATTAEFQEQLDSVGGSVSVGNLPLIDGDSGELRQLFENLLSNAIKFRRANEPVRIDVFEDDSLSNGAESIVVFADNGIGFEEQYAEKVFSIFKRLHGRSEYPGTGIGLAICRKIVGRHGGSIRAIGIPGEGARFVLALPRSNGEVAKNGATDA